jgi:hypothetical protein
VRAAALNAAQVIAGKGPARERAEKALADEHLGVRLAAARLLGDDPRALAVLVEALGQADVALTAAIDLARRGDPRGLDALDRLVEAGGEPPARRAAADAYLQARRASVGVVVALADDDPVVRIAAAEAILTVVTD